MKEKKKSEALVVFVINLVRGGSVKVFQAMDECDSSHDQIYMIPECTRPTIGIYDYVRRKCYEIWKAFKWNWISAAPYK